MAFVLNKNATYFWPVKFEMPVDGGRFETISIDLKFKRISQSEIQKVLDAKDTTDESFVKHVVCGWKDIVDEKENEIPFSESALSDLLDIPMLTKAIVMTYLESLGGSKTKN